MGCPQSLNETHGIWIGSGASQNTIGGSLGVDGNIISGNLFDGIVVNGTGTDRNKILSNQIGLSSASIALPNGRNGVRVDDGATNTVIGSMGAGNVISGNDRHGIEIDGAGTERTIVQANMIGTTVDATAAIPNEESGIFIHDGADENVIGGVVSGEGNTIAFNLDGGVKMDLRRREYQFWTLPGPNNSVRGNSIYLNVAQAIDLGDHGLAAIDDPSGLDNGPVLNSALRGGSTTTVSGTLLGKANENYHVDFYENAGAAGVGDAQRFLGTTDVTADSAGFTGVAFTHGEAIPLGNTITATVTDSNGKTSELSLPLSVAASDGLPLVTIMDRAITEGDSESSSLEFEVRLSHPASGALSIPFSVVHHTTVAADFDSLSGTVTIPPGSTTGTARVSVSGDTDDESDETFTLRLSDAASVHIVDRDAKGTIFDNDSAHQRPFGAETRDLAAFLLGKVGVDVIVLDSDGSVDAEVSRWTPAQAASLKANVESGFQWWVDTLATVSTEHELSFDLNFDFVDTPISVPHEALSRATSDFALGINSFLDFASVERTNRYVDDLRLFMDQRRLESGNDWHFSIFVTLNSNDFDGAYADLESIRYFGASELWLLPQNDVNERGIVHESGHVFYAMDEYDLTNPDGSPLSHTYTDRSGYYNTQNTNAFHGNNGQTARVDSVMSHGQEQLDAYAAHTSSPQSLAMLGWQDSDGDGIFDVLDQPLSLNVDIERVGNDLRVVGTSSVTRLPNQNPAGSGNDITINRVKRLDYRINGGQWQTLQQFDEGSVAFDHPITAEAGDTVEFQTVAQIEGIRSPIRAITINSDPVLEPIGDRQISELDVLTFGVAASDADSPASGLTFGLDSGAPDGATIHPNTGVFSWTPTESQGPGTYDVTIRVTDDGTPPLDDFETIQIVVGEINQAPTLVTIGNLSANEGVELNFTANADDLDMPVNGLTFSLDAGAPVGASIDPATGVFSWTPTENQGPGIYDVTVRVADDGTPALSDVETIQITVGEVNQTPALAPIGNRSVDEGVLLSFTASASDFDMPGDLLTFSLDTGAPTGASIDSTTGDFSWTPTEDQGPGIYNVTVRVADNGTPQLDDFEMIQILVGEVNQSPTLAPIGNLTVDEGVELSFTATADDLDLPVNGLTFSLDAGAPTGASIDPTSGEFTWMPTESQGPGTFEVTVRVTDDATPALSDVETIQITIGEVNQPPTLAPIGNLTVDEGLELSFTATAEDLDLPVNGLTFSLDAGAPTGASIDPTSGEFTWMPTENQGPGTFDVTVRVTDDGTPALNDTETIQITVGEVNQSPTLAPIGNLTVDEGVELSFTATAEDLDLPVDTLTFSLDAGAPTGASIDPTSGEFTWMPTENQGPGIYDVTVRVTDDGTPALNDTKTIQITVGEVNQSPTLAPIGNLTVNEGIELSFTATADDLDFPVNELTFSLDAGAPIGASINPTSGVFSWAPTEDLRPGIYPVTFRVTDNGVPPREDFETIQISVGAVNQSPTLAAIGNLTVDEGLELNFTASAEDLNLPVDRLTFSLDAGAPTGASIDPTSGEFSWTPTENQGPGTFDVTVRVTDDGTPPLGDFETIQIVVGEINQAPTLAPIGNLSANGGVELNFTANADDLDMPADALTFSLGAGAPVGASIDPATGRVLLDAHRRSGTGYIRCDRSGH